MGNPFAEIALVLLAAAVVGAIGTWLRQPLIVSCIAVGILVGPAGIGPLTQHDQIELLASIGIALLLFVVGLKLDLHTIGTLGPVALPTPGGHSRDDWHHRDRWRRDDRAQPDLPRATIFLARSQGGLRGSGPDGQEPELTRMASHE